jgi:hypothetical protein
MTGPKRGADHTELMVSFGLDLRSNFRDETANPFTVGRARHYLLGLPKSAARRYINNAPLEVDTPLRRAMQETRWL